MRNRDRWRGNGGHRPGRIVTGGGRAGGGERSPSTRSVTPWVETREGGLFFVNFILAIPELVVLFPLVMKGLLGSLGLVEGSSVYLDTFPTLAAHALPWAGWLLVVPTWTTIRNLRMEVPRAAGIALWLLLGVHLAYLAWTVAWWVTGGGVPGAP